jgi:hypothetical protein
MERQRPETLLAQSMVQLATSGSTCHLFNNPVYQGIDQSKLVPLLTAALQEAIGGLKPWKLEVSALERRVVPFTSDGVTLPPP